MVERARKQIKEKVARAYDQIHTPFDASREEGMIALTNLLLRDLEIPKNTIALDIGCGTGCSTFELFKRCNYKGSLYGIDISRKSIDKAIQNAAERGYSDIKFQVGDAEQLDFPDSMFHLVISNMCFQFIPNKNGALSEILRVLKPGGLVALTYPGKQCYHEAREVLLEVTERHNNNPEIAEAVKENDKLLIDLEESINLFESAGFTNSNLHGIHQIQYVHPSWFLKTSSGTWGLWKYGLSPRIVDRIHDDLLTELKLRVSDKGFKLTWYLIIVSGMKPE
jgi:ubiquinone/menaquinone biosynthesis C-methylase UbiE